MSDRIPVAGPWVTQKEIDLVTEAATHAWYGRADEYNARFEQAFAKYIGVRQAISLPSCTSAIHLALAALDIGPGDEVVVPDATWIASAAPIDYVGATPVFADIDPTTWCLSADSLTACLTERTRAVIAVDLYGGVPDYDSLRQATAAHGLHLIEDAAEAIGAEYHERRAGSLGDVGVFSFHGSKTLTTGEGGMLVSDDSELCQRVMFLRDHGRRPGDRLFFNAEVAYKYKMSSFQAAFGLAQLSRVEELVQKKRQLFHWYADLLTEVPGITLNPEPAGTRNGYWMITVAWADRYRLDKVKLMEELDREGIDSRPFFHPLSDIPAYRERPEAKAAAQRNRQAYALCSRALNLPSALSLTEEQVERVCRVLRRVLQEHEVS